jgi:RNA polymerase sigma factor (sigma-70 family)
MSSARRLQPPDSTVAFWNPMTDDPTFESYVARHTLAELYRREYPAMMRLAYMLTGERQTAEDLVHDVWIKVASRLDRLDDPVPYLRRAVVNATHSHHRRRAIIRRNAVHAGDRYEDDHELSDFRDALLTLRAPQRTAVVLRYLYQLPDDEIAEIIGCRTATVRSLVHRGLAHLRTELS